MNRPLDSDQFKFQNNLAFGISGRTVTPKAQLMRGSHTEANLFHIYNKENEDGDFSDKEKEILKIVSNSTQHKNAKPLSGNVLQEGNRMWGETNKRNNNSRPMTAYPGTRPPLSKGKPFGSNTSTPSDINKRPMSAAVPQGKRDGAKIQPQPLLENWNKLFFDCKRLKNTRSTKDMFFNSKNYKELGSRCPIVSPAPLQKMESWGDLTLATRPATAQIFSGSRRSLNTTHPMQRPMSARSMTSLMGRTSSPASPTSAKDGSGKSMSLLKPKLKLSTYKLHNTLFNITMEQEETERRIKEIENRVSSFKEDEICLIGSAGSHERVADTILKVRARENPGSDAKLALKRANVRLYLNSNKPLGAFNKNDVEFTSKKRRSTISDLHKQLHLVRKDKRAIPEEDEEDDECSMLKSHNYYDENDPHIQYLKETVHQSSGFNQDESQNIANSNENEQKIFQRKRRTKKSKNKYQLQEINMRIPGQNIEEDEDDQAFYDQFEAAPVLKSNVNYARQIQSANPLSESDRLGAIRQFAKTNPRIKEVLSNNNVEFNPNFEEFGKRPVTSPTNGVREKPFMQTLRNIRIKDSQQNSRKISVENDKGELNSLEVMGQKIKVFAKSPTIMNQKMFLDMFNSDLMEQDVLMEKFQTMTPIEQYQYLQALVQIQQLQQPIQEIEELNHEHLQDSVRNEGLNKSPSDPTTGMTDSSKGKIMNNIQSFSKESESSPPQIGSEPIISNYSSARTMGNEGLRRRPIRIRQTKQKRTSGKCSFNLDMKKDANAQKFEEISNNRNGPDEVLSEKQLFHTHELELGLKRPMSARPQTVSGIRNISTKKGVIEYIPMPNQEENMTDAFDLPNEEDKEQIVSPSNKTQVFTVVSSYSIPVARKRPISAAVNPSLTKNKKSVKLDINPKKNFQQYTKYLNDLEEHAQNLTIQEDSKDTENTALREAIENEEDEILENGFKFQMVPHGTGKFQFLRTHELKPHLRKLKRKKKNKGIKNLQKTQSLATFKLFQHVGVNGTNIDSPIISPTFKLKGKFPVIHTRPSKSTKTFNF